MKNKIANLKKKEKLSISLFKEGKFTEAETGFQDILKENKNSYNSLFYLGRIKLLSNQLEKAKELLLKALELNPTKDECNHLLGEIFYRLNKFDEASEFYEALGRKAVAKKLASFKGTTPYQIDSEKEISILKFIVSEPLPVVQIQINNSEPVNFFIDTGGAELILDRQFSQEIGAETFGSEKGTFAGGKTAPFQHGKVDCVILGDFTIKNVPIHIMDLPKIIFKDISIDGIIGTIVFYQFIASIDYPNNQLILRKKSNQNLIQYEKKFENNNYVNIPFWLAGDHYMVAWGKVNNSKPLLFFIDTGLVGGGFICSKSTIKEGKINLEGERIEGIGGGGKTSAIPFLVEELSFGETKEKNIQGVYFDKFHIEHLHGFHIGGLISHDYFRNYTVTLDFSKMRIFLTRK
jgi:tetratricopeptide (TPR) repeat protein